MKSRLFFLLFGFALGVAIFWLPTATAGGRGFVLPMVLPGPWYFAAIPHLVLLAVIFGLLAGIYRLLKKPFPMSLADGGWILLGIYLSLTILLHFVGVAVGGGKLTI